jgi:hypothetical protein
MATQPGLESKIDILRPRAIFVLPCKQYAKEELQFILYCKSPIVEWGPICCTDEESVLESPLHKPGPEISYDIPSFSPIIID